MKIANKTAGAAATLLLVMVLGCGTDLPNAPSPPAPTVAFKAAAVSQASGLAVCNRQRYATVSSRIGPNGGKLKVGGHEFEVPRGALSSPVMITMTAVADNVHSVRFAPEGLVFNAGSLPSLKLDYDGCRIPHGAKWRIAYVTESLQILDLLGSVDDPLNTDVDGHIKHFSRYAVAF